MVIVIVQSIKNLSQRQMWKVVWNIFGVYAQTPDFNNRPNRCARIFDNWLSAQNLIICDDMGMFPDTLEIPFCR